MSYRRATGGNWAKNSDFEQQGHKKDSFAKLVKFSTILLTFHFLTNFFSITYFQKKNIVSFRTIECLISFKKAPKEIENEIAPLRK